MISVNTRPLSIDEAFSLKLQYEDSPNVMLNIYMASCDTITGFVENEVYTFWFFDKSWAASFKLTWG